MLPPLPLISIPWAGGGRGSKNRGELRQISQKQSEELGETGSHPGKVTMEEE